MARGARLTSGGISRAAALLAVVAGAQGVHGASPDLRAFLGIWAFRGGSQVQATCVGFGPVTPHLDPARASIYLGTTTDLVLDIGCSCLLGLNVDGDRATLAGPQTCMVVSGGQQITGDIDTFTVDRAGDGTLGIALAGAHGHLTTTSAACDLNALSGTGTLERVGDGAVTCGAPETAVGILPVDGYSTTDCPLGAGREGLRIQTHDQDDPPCNSANGGLGEGHWILPDDQRERTPVCPTASYMTTLHFCRVDGALLRPLTTAADPSQYYAVLKLGSICPNGSVEVGKTIDNEDTPTGSESERSGVIGEDGPANSVEPDPAIGTKTKLTFCYFRNAASPEGVMEAFPDYGIPYAVFHRYAGEQPPWVLMRRWQYSDDEDGQKPFNSYEAADPTVIPEFEEVIENPGSTNTIYNYARVR